MRILDFTDRHIEEILGLIIETDKKNEEGNNICEHVVINELYDFHKETEASILDKANKLQFERERHRIRVAMVQKKFDKAQKSEDYETLLKVVDELEKLDEEFEGFKSRDDEINSLLVELYFKASNVDTELIKYLTREQKVELLNVINEEIQKYYEVDKNSEDEDENEETQKKNIE
jgi:hypothetical protein